MKSCGKPPKLARKDAALRRFLNNTDLTLAMVETAPQVSEIVKGALGSTKKGIAALRFSGEPCAIAFLQEYDAIPAGDRDLISLEAICVKATVNPAALLGSILMSWKMVRAQESALLAIDSHPEVLRDTIKYAALPGGDKDRKLIHEAVGFLPSPKGGTSFAVNILNGKAEVKKTDEPEEEDFGSMFPTITGSLETWSGNRRKALGDGK